MTTRLVLLAVAVPACTLNNSFDGDLLLVPEPPPPVERCDDGADNDDDGLIDCADPDCAAQQRCGDESDACDDGVDNDGDALQDCADPDCWSGALCWAESRFEEVSPCEPARPSWRISDAFSKLDTQSWTPFWDDPADEAYVDDEGYLHASGDARVGPAGLAGVETFTVGAQQPFDLFAGFIASGDCSPDGADHGCGFYMELHSADVARHGLSEAAGDPLISTFVSTRSDGQNFDVQCYVRGRTVGSFPVFVNRTGDPRFVLRVRLDPDTGEVVWEKDDHEPTSCRSRPLLDVEPPVRLVLAGLHSRDRAGEFVLDGVTAIVDQQRRDGPCKGRRAPLIPESGCATRGLTDTNWPKVVNLGPGHGHWMLYAAGPSHKLQRIALAQSADGRTDWEVATHALPDSDTGVIRLGAVVHDPNSDTVRMWASTHANGAPTLHGPRLFEADVDDPLAWRVVGDVIMTRAGQTVRVGRWVPDSVVLQDGRYVAWGRPAWAATQQGVARLTSADGLAWEADVKLVLTPGDDGAWDDGSLGFPSVAPYGDLLLMAYAGRRSVEPASLGLAVSEDGVTWRRHRDNPLVTPEVPFFDDNGLGAPSLLIDGDLLRLWYQGDTLLPRRCPEFPKNSLGTRREIGLVELQWAP